MTRAEIITEARRYLGVRYQKKGRSERGLDCLGLLVMLGRTFDVPHTDAQDYSDWPRSDHLILHTLDRYLIRQSPLTPPALWPGLVGVFAERRLPGHTGVFSERDRRVYLIHARINPPCVIEECWDQVPRHELRLIGLYAFPGMTD